MSSQSSAINHQFSADPVKATRFPTPVRITDQVWPEGTVPVVTIRCITYNHVNFIRDAIEGFLMQETTFPVEILIHDDASTDGTAEIIRKYQEKYPQLFRAVLQKENQWSKRNRKPFEDFEGMARGEFIALCEGDDYWICKEKLQKQFEILNSNHELSMVFHNAQIINTRHGHTHSYLIHDKPLKPIHKTEDLLKQWYIPTASIFYRKYSDFTFPDWFYSCQSGDIPLLLLISLKGDLYCLNEVMSVYRMHLGGISITHQGYSKAVGMIYTYESFNIYTGSAFEKKIQEAIEHEIRSHWPAFKNLEKKLQEYEKYYNQHIIKFVYSRFKKKIKSVFINYKRSLS